MSHSTNEESEIAFLFAIIDELKPNHILNQCHKAGKRMDYKIHLEQSPIQCFQTPFLLPSEAASNVLYSMSGSTVKGKRGASYDPTATADLSPVSESDEVFKSSGSGNNAGESSKKANKVKKKTKKIEETKEQSAKVAKKKSKK